MEFVILMIVLYDKDELPVLRQTIIYAVVRTIEHNPRPTPAWTEKSYYFSFFSQENKICNSPSQYALQSNPNSLHISYSIYFV